MLCRLKELLTVVCVFMKCDVYHEAASSHLWKALFVYMVHHDYLIVVAGGGTSWAEGKNRKTV